MHISPNDCVDAKQSPLLDVQLIIDANLKWAQENAHNSACVCALV